MGDILVPSLFSGVILAFMYVNLFLASSFINLKKANTLDAKVNPKIIFSGVMLIYPVCAGVSFLIALIYLAIDNYLIFAFLIITLSLIVSFGSYILFKLLRIVLIGCFGFLLLNLLLLPFIINA